MLPHGCQTIHGWYDNPRAGSDPAAMRLELPLPGPHGPGSGKARRLTGELDAYPLKLLD
ncbi:hypothetical protein JKG68_28795 [Microvirga aerilata]|uniref:Uncharacterized protein n=1 Tax=Microvirga aerilata TaxID=670292 RepID=A0A936ZNN8_9HYPH|nr:hypothetical protein [Microvirga aerilata]MBL0407903.1 hypothetical protein [Microvirga aerilata]